MKPISPWILGAPKQSFHLVIENGNGDSVDQKTPHISPSIPLSRSLLGNDKCPHSLVGGVSVTALDLVWRQQSWVVTGEWKVEITPCIDLIGLAPRVPTGPVASWPVSSMCRESWLCEVGVWVPATNKDKQKQNQ